MRLRLFPFVILVVMTGLLLGCGKKPPADDKANNPGGQGPGSPGGADVTGVLYPPTAAPTYQATWNRNEPLVISNALAQFEERQSVPAEVDGTVDVVATEIQPGEKVDPGLIVYMRQDKNRTTPMRRIIEGE